MKKLILLIVIINLSFTLVGCYDNDDWAPYDIYSRDVNIVLSTNVNAIADIIPDIDAVALKQQENLALTNVFMIFEGRSECDGKTGTIIFRYAKAHEKINQVSKMDIYFNMKERKIEKFDWEKGHGKRLNIITNKIGDKYIKMSISDMFLIFNQDEEYIDGLKNINPRLKIDLNFNRMSAYLYDVKNDSSTIVFRYNSKL